MSLTQLRYFCEVVATGSIREASERLNIAPSAVSRQIQNVEADAGLPLFERHPRGMRLTAAGELYAQHARQVLLDAVRVQSEIDDLKGLRRGNVRVHTVEGIVSSFVVPAIAAFRGKFPGVSFYLVVTASEFVEAAVRENETDIGIAFNTHPHPEVTYVSRLRDPLVAVVSSTHPFAMMPNISLSELATFPIAVPDSSFGIRMLFDQQCRRCKVSLSPVVVTNSIEALRAFAISGSGIAVMTSRAITQGVAEGTLVGIPLEGSAFQNATIDICVRTNRRLPPATSEFVRSLPADSSTLP